MGQDFIISTESVSNERKMLCMCAVHPSVHTLCGGWERKGKRERERGEKGIGWGG